MSDRDQKNDNQDFDDKTVSRQEPNDDKTAVRRNPAAGDEPDGGSDETLVRQPKDEETSPAAGSGDATIIRDEDAGPSRHAPEPSADKPADGDNATILRGGGSGEHSTILRGPRGEHATILRGAQSDDATVLRGGADEDDATIVPHGGDDDSTIINRGGDDDSTVISGGRDADTTYVASGGGGGGRSKGNSEAGRLLKNRFVLEEKVGSGGMGDVYKALDLRQQEAQERNPYIAIKILNENFARHKDAFISLQREATRTRGIPHPNIMAVYDFDREGDTVFMSMELLDGKPLDDYLRDHPEGVSVEDAWNIIDGICQGLSRAHGAGIVHSDFKPGNIYYTADKLAKVFDFGIARAVSNPGDLKADGEKTVFDAGSLGALTPTYASYEMLVGKEPTKSDDVYAVALVAYELFTGRHPYNRTPADKALERGLEPEPVPFLRRRHWRALKKGLALKGEDRYESIDEFHADMFSEDPPVFRYAAVAMVLLGSIAFGTYTLMFGGEEVPQQYTEYLGRLEASKGFLREELGALATELYQIQQDGTPEWNFRSEDWRNDIRVNLVRLRGFDLELREKYGKRYAQYLNALTQQRSKDVKPLKAEEDIENWKNRVLEVYLAEIDNVSRRAKAVAREAVEIPSDGTTLERLEAENEIAERTFAELEHARVLLAEAKEHYSFNPAAIANIESKVNVEMAVATDELDDVAREIENELAAIAKAEADAEAARQEEERIRQRDAVYLALREGDGMREPLESEPAEYADINPQHLREILKCKGDLSEEDLADLDTVLNGPGQLLLDDFGVVPHQGLRGTFSGQFELDLPGIVHALRGCIEQRIAVRAPDRAREVKARVLGILPGQTEIASVVIEDLDPCAKRNLEGRGNRNGSWCSDQLSVGGEGPELVVVPPKTNSDQKFAISRIEIMRGDYNRYCEEVGCQTLPGSNTLPATNISLEQARAYTEWLSDQTGRQYRLPTEEEWLYAAATDGTEDVDDNVNCTVDARGVRLGDTLVSTLSGRPNKWGLYNFVGNAREWALAEESVVAMGGAHTDPKSECTLDKKVAHTGEPDPVTGFRIVRPVEG